jgi:hypothetical protein
VRKWLTIGILALAAAVSILIPAKVHALSHENPVVHITVSAYIVAAPSGLVLTYVSDNQIDISWIKGVDAENTVVVVKYDSIPTNRNDGYQVYYGDGEFVSDTNVDLTSPRVPYYRAWSERIDGHWEPYGVSGEANFMSLSYTFIGLIVITLGLVIICLVFRKPLFAILSAFAWLVCDMFIYFSFDSTTYYYFPLIAFFFFCFLSMIIMAYTMRTKPEEIPKPLSHTERLRSNLEQYRAARKRW